jgi:hypothetical protein
VHILIPRVYSTITIIRVPNFRTIIWVWSWIAYIHTHKHCRLSELWHFIKSSVHLFCRHTVVHTRSDYCSFVRLQHRGGGVKPVRDGIYTRVQSSIERGRAVNGPCKTAADIWRARTWTASPVRLSIPTYYIRDIIMILRVYAII